MAIPPTGLMIIRAWIEKGSKEPLLAQIRLTTDISGALTKEITLTDISGVQASVGQWLADVLAMADVPGRD